MKPNHSLRLSYYEKWALIGLLVGIIAGLSSMAVFYTLRLVEYVFLVRGAGIALPVPIGEGGSVTFSYTALRPYLLPAIAATGAFVSGILIRFSSSASGNGTDKTIEAFHYKHGKFDKIGWLVKLVASAFTIGTGGSAGREGPEAFISASLSSNISGILKISPEDRRKVVAVALGAGIGTIFKSPIAGALLSAELLYKRDFEYEVIFPSLIASAVGYMIFGLAVGYGPIFGIYIYTFSVYQVPYFLLLGLICGAFAILYVKSMLGFERVFGRLRLPLAVRAAIGGLAVGTIGVMFPEIISVGYGWMNLIMLDKTDELLGLGLSPLLILILLPFLKILATSLTIGSGGSGGEFAPGIMIGGLVGAAFGVILNLFSGNSYSLVPYAVIGMAALFGAAANAPIAVMIMAIEMGGSIELLPPAMLASVVSYLIARKFSLYHSQVATRRDSPAHMQEYSIPLLSTIKVEDVSIRNIFASIDSSVNEAVAKMKSEGLASIPVIDSNGKFVGIAMLSDLGEAKTLSEKIVRGTPYIRPESNLEQAWEALATSRSSWVPVVKEGKFVGIITINEMLDGYKKFSKMQQA
ncbi:MAG: chloride channel protein [Nitrososphaeria archaeon]